MRGSVVIVFLLAAKVFLRADPARADPEAGTRLFEERIRPLLIDRCYECHSSSSPKLKGGLNLESRDTVLKGGESGPVVVPGKPEESLLIKAIRYSDQGLQMPPRHQLPPGEIKLLEQWVAMGAPDTRINGPTLAKAPGQRHWAFQPVSNPALPKVRNGRWIQQPLDHFILVKLEERGLTPNFVADKCSLIRRATFDLTGLPPTRAEIEDFLRDRSIDSFEKVLDRLLASPRYGERWGRFWLDLARYADTGGDSADYPIPQAYRYRNYVINAFNTDKPYDQFIREQIAGDLLPAESERDRRQKIIATGYLALARRFGVDPESVHHLTLDDALDTMGRSILGLSLSCARCHDHKFDPIPTEDYYGLYGILSSTHFPFPGSENKKRPEGLVPLRPEQIDSEWKPFTNRLAQLETKIRKVREEIEFLRREELSTADAWKALKQATEERDELIEDPPDIDFAFSVSEGRAGNARIQRRGDPGTPGPEVPRRFLRVLGNQQLAPGERGSGRLELAQWLTAATNPLTARVLVNRIWQRHFAKGLVHTPSDFGSRGQPPSHPELLDYLAGQFVRGGWSIKRLHKVIMLSSTYQQSSLEDGRKSKIDPENKWLGRFPRQRLDAEALRDSLLMLAGELDLSRGGPHPFPSEFQWNYTQHSQFTAHYETRQRTVYLMQQRIRRDPYLGLFDGADPNSSTAERSASTTPLQALFAMNNGSFHEWAASFANRLVESSGEDALEEVYWQLFGRPPTREESLIGRNYLAAYRQRVPDNADRSDAGKGRAWLSFVRALLCSNEFLYVD